MIVEYIRYKITQGAQSEFLRAYKEAAVILAESKYCLGYELSHCDEDRDNFILRIEWTSTGDHLNGFRKSAEFASFFRLVKPFLNDILEMNHYCLTDVVNSRNKNL